MRRLSLDDPIVRCSQRVFRNAILKTIRGRAALGGNAQLQYSLALYEPINADHKRPEAHVGFFALYLHNARRIWFWVYDKSHVGAGVNRPRDTPRLLIGLVGTDKFELRRMLGFASRRLQARFGVQLLHTAHDELEFPQPSLNRSAADIRLTATRPPF